MLGRMMYLVERRRHEKTANVADEKEREVLVV